MNQFLTFVVGDDEYGVGILTAREIIEHDRITAVPNAPPYVRGVINLRGAVVPVVDLALRFGRPAGSVSRRSCIVVVEVSTDEGRIVMGILADEVRQVVELADDAIEPAPSFGTGIRPEWLRGLGRADQRFLLLLDTDRVLTLSELRRVEHLETAGAA